MSANVWLENSPSFSPLRWCCKSLSSWGVLSWLSYKYGSHSVVVLKNLGKRNTLLSNLHHSLSAQTKKGCSVANCCVLAPSTPPLQNRLSHSCHFQMNILFTEANCPITQLSIFFWKPYIDVIGVILHWQMEKSKSIKMNRMTKAKDSLKRSVRFYTVSHYGLKAWEICDSWKFSDDWAVENKYKCTFYFTKIILCRHSPCVPAVAMVRALITF